MMKFFKKFQRHNQANNNVAPNSNLNDISAINVGVSSGNSSNYPSSLHCNKFTNENYNFNNHNIDYHHDHGDINSDWDHHSITHETHKDSNTHSDTSPIKVEEVHAHGKFKTKHHHQTSLLNHQNNSHEFRHHSIFHRSDHIHELSSTSTSLSAKHKPQSIAIPTSSCSTINTRHEHSTPINTSSSTSPHSSPPNTPDETVESMENHGNLLTHLISQLHIGMDLTKVVLPTFILEKRSLLEMYSDFLAHPDLFVSITDQLTPKDRLIQTVRWYLSAFHAGRKSGVAKKPYNPILGECFKCFYELPQKSLAGCSAVSSGPTFGMAGASDVISAALNEEEVVDKDRPIPWCTKNNLSFVAEQVSHHPPISAFYAECFKKRISINGYIWTKSKFLGLSVCVHMIGQAVISVLDHDEDYVVTFPNGYGRSILTIPWMELGGKVSITCSKTGFNAQIEFLTKPFYGGKKDQVVAEMFDPNDKKPFATVKGEWNGVMTLKHGNINEIFLDTKNMPIIKKQVKPVDQQEEFESRRLWKNVTLNLKARNIEKATEFKCQIERMQRDEAKIRKDEGVPYETKLFHEVGAHWVFDKPLVNRIKFPMATANNTNTNNIYTAH